MWRPLDKPWEVPRPQNTRTAARSGRQDRWRGKAAPAPEPRAARRRAALTAASTAVVSTWRGRLAQLMGFRYARFESRWGYPIRLRLRGLRRCGGARGATRSRRDPRGAAAVRVGLRSPAPAPQQARRRRSGAARSKAPALPKKPAARRPRRDARVEDLTEWSGLGADLVSEGGKRHGPACSVTTDARDATRPGSSSRSQCHSHTTFRARPRFT